MAESYGIFLTHQDLDGTKVTIFRSEWAEVERDLEAAFGEGAVDGLKGRLQKKFGGAQVEVPDAETVVKVGLGGTEEEPEPPVESDDEEQRGFEPCQKCGSPKDKWVPPGVSKRTGKKYSGFWGCGNPNCR